MKRYWDFTERERAKLTEEDVRNLLAYELMDRGVVRVTAPVLIDVPVVEAPTAQLYVVKEKSSYGREYAFESIDDARKLVELRPLVVNSGYQRPDYVKEADFSIVTESVMREADYRRLEQQLRQKAEAEEINQKAKAEYEKQKKEEEAATADVWTDWYRCGELEVQRERIRKTFAEYLKMTEGNEEMARAFLAKAYKDPVEVAEALSPDGKVTPPPAAPEKPESTEAEIRK